MDGVRPRMGNPKFGKSGDPGAATRFKPGNPGAKPGRAIISQRRLRKMVHTALPHMKVLDVLGGAELESLRPVVIAQVFRRLIGDKSQTSDEWSAADRMIDFLWPRLQSAPPPAPPEPTVQERLAAIHAMYARPAAPEADDGA